MNKKLYNSYLMIDKEKIQQNIESVLQQLSPQTQLIPVLKCNAYGLGLKEMSQLIQQIPAIRMAAAAQVIEALEMRTWLPDKEILVLGATTQEEQYQAAIEQDLTLTAYRVGFLSKLAQTARRCGKKAAVHIKINTGLNRLGVRVGEELARMLEEILEYSDAVQVTGVFSHFSELVSPHQNVAAEEYREFSEAVAQIEKAGILVGMRHLCASAAWEIHPEFSLDAVRLGRRLYYDHPTFPRGGVQEAVSWRARILDIQQRKKGETIGYGGEVVLPQDTRIALLGVGYGDGLYLDLVRKQAPVLVKGQRVHLLACCMDQCFVDLQDLDCAIGDEVTLFGYDEFGNLLPGQEVAGLIQEEACTLTSALGPRVLRIYR